MRCTKRRAYRAYKSGVNTQCVSVISLGGLTRSAMVIRRHGPTTLRALEVRDNESKSWLRFLRHGSGSLSWVVPSMLHQCFVNARPRVGQGCRYEARWRLRAESLDLVLSLLQPRLELLCEHLEVLDVGGGTVRVVWIGSRAVHQLLYLAGGKVGRTAIW